MLDRHAPHRRWWLYLMICVAALGLWPRGIGHGLAKAFAQESPATSEAPAEVRDAGPAATPTAEREQADVSHDPADDKTKGSTSSP